MNDIILSSEMEDFYNQLNALRVQFSLSQITPPADYQKNTKIKAEQWNTLLDNVDDVVVERNLEYTTKPEKVAQKQIIKKDNTKVLLQENIDFMKTLCVNYSVDVSSCAETWSDSKKTITGDSRTLTGNGKSLPTDGYYTCSTFDYTCGDGGGDSTTSYSNTPTTTYTNSGQVCAETISYATCVLRVNP